MRLLWWTTAFPYLPTAYAKVTRYMARHLEQDLGHEVHILSNLGHEGGTFTIDGLRLYPQPAGTAHMGETFMYRLYHRLGCQAVIWHGDCWPWPQTFADVGAEVPLILHCPVDHFPLSNYEKLAMSKIVALMALCKFSKGVAEQENVRCYYAPHGVDPTIYKREDPAACRQTLKWPEDAFIFLFVGTNKQDRKNQVNLLRAYKLFLDKVPEARERTRLALHTYPHRDKNNDAGYELWNIAVSLGIIKNTIWTDDEGYIEGLTEQQLNLMYNAADVHVLPSKTEGFGIPIIEAGAVGTPSIVTDFSSMPELVPESCGWRVKVIDYEVQQLQGITWQAIPWTDHLADLMAHCFNNPDEVQEKGRRMEEFTLANFPWEKVVHHWEPLFDFLEKRPEGWPSWLP